MTDKTEALPPLPEPEAHFSVDDNGKWRESSRGMPMFTIEHLHAYARAALAQRQQVPAEATDAMIEAAEEVDGLYRLGTPNTWRKVWRAMLAAAPALTAAPSAQAEPVACIGGNPACPCQDGDACHYQDAADGTKAMPIPPTRDREADRARFRAACRAEALEEAAPVLSRAAEMLTAYAELVKATGKYAEMHYVPEIEYLAAAIREMK